MTDDLSPARLLAGLAAAPDDFDHPEHDHLAGFVDGTLEDTDREWVHDHLECCNVCREDVADLAAVALLMPHRRRWMTTAVALGGVAAGVLLIILVGGRTTSPQIDAPQVVSAPPAAASAPTAQPSVLTAEEQSQVTRALESGWLEFPANAALLRGHSGTLLGATDAGPAFTPSAPLDTSIVDVRPEFTWTALKDATGYSVAVFDERFHEVAHSGLLTSTAWTPDLDLPRGKVLAWQITAHGPAGEIVSPAPPQPEARFFVLNHAAMADLAAQRKRLADEPVALGLALTRLGLFAEATQAFDRALSDSRYDPVRIEALLARVRER